MITNKLRLWYQNLAGDFVPLCLNAACPLWISQSTPIPSEQPAESAVGIRTISPRAPFIGVAIVPADLQDHVAINGIPIGSGLHGLRHADRLDVNGHSVWVAASLSVETTTYDPAVHGEQIYCFISKLPLVLGQEIVLCPGVPGRPCNVIYAKDAWDRAMQTQTNLRCANCKFHPDDAEWTPTVQPSRKRIDEILSAAIDGRE